MFHPWKLRLMTKVEKKKRVALLTTRTRFWIFPHSVLSFLLYLSLLQAFLARLHQEASHWNTAVLLSKATSFQPCCKAASQLLINSVRIRLFISAGEVLGRGGFSALVDPETLRRCGCSRGLSCLGYQVLSRPAITRLEPEQHRRMQIDSGSSLRQKGSQSAECIWCGSSLG